LPDQDYQTAGFEPAKVKRVSGGFEVTRWIYWTSGWSETTAARSGIQKICEFVGEDGEYRRSTVTEMDPQKAPELSIPDSFQ